jgi:hypothetical protein
MNQILVRQNLPSIQMTEPTPLLNIGWILAAAIGVMWGAWWAIPAALAGAAHERYAARTSIRLRGALAQRMQALLSRQRPALDVQTPFSFRLICVNTMCRQQLQEAAGFCPRCGTRVSKRVNAIA